LYKKPADYRWIFYCKISVFNKNQFKGVGLHKFSLLFAVLPQHLQMNLGLDVNFLTLSKSNLCAGCVN